MDIVLGAITGFLYDEQLLWFALSLLSVAVSAALLLTATQGVRVIAPVHLFLIYYICFVYIGSFIGFLESPNEYAKTFRIVTIGLLCFGAGVAFSSAYHGFDSGKELDRIKAQPLKDPWTTPYHIHALFCVFAGGLVLAAMYFVHAGTIPAFAEVVETARVNATRGGGYFWLAIAIVLPFVCLTSIGKTIIAKNSRSKMVTASVFFITVFVMFLTATKDLIPFFLLWIVFFFQFYAGRISKKLIFVPVVSLLIALVLSGFTMAHQLSLEEDTTFIMFAIGKLSNRVIFAVVDVVQFLIHNIPLNYDYFLGYSYWMNIRAALVPGHFLGFGGWVNTEAFDMGGGATVPVVAEFYANFGEWGSYIAMIYAGFIVQTIYIYFLRKLAADKRLDTLIATTFLSMGLVSLAINSVFGYILYILLPVGACLVFVKRFPAVLRLLTMRNTAQQSN